MILAASISSILPLPHAKAAEGKGKKHRQNTPTRYLPDKPVFGAPPKHIDVSKLDFLQPITAVPPLAPTFEAAPERGVGEGRYPWRRDIVTTTFWIGEKPTKNNPVPNDDSSWDQQWAENYGGTDTPDKALRVDYRPAAFVPRQNPFYVALPYNDMQRSGHKPEAETVVPWFKEEFKGKGQSVLKGRWLAIRFKDRVAYAQWEDCGPFRTDHSAYVFGTERPRANLNKGAGLDVSPGVRDYLGMNDSDVTDWKFVEFADVPPGPWTQYGDNNTFVINKRKNVAQTVALEAEKSSAR